MPIDRRRSVFSRRAGALPSRSLPTVALILGAMAAALPAVPPAAAQTPLSAIDWLSDSVADPESPAPLAEPVARNALPHHVTVTPLGRPASDALGLIAPGELDLPADLWGATGTARLVQLLSRDMDGLPPGLMRFYRDLLTARLTPPPDAEGDLFLARLDALLAMGALDQAADLIARAEQGQPEHFRRAFDISLLKGTENRACARMRHAPAVTPTYAARIFCLARTGDWRAAALTLETATALDVLSPEDEGLALRFLDDALAEDLGALPPPRRPTPLQFAMFEAVGEPVPTGTLPLAFAHADLRGNAGWKARIEAGERLARAGVLPPDRLWAIYAEREPAASGGTWDRVAAFHRLDRALSRGEAAEPALETAWQTALADGLALPFALHYGPRLAEAGIDTPLAARLVLLAGEDLGEVPGAVPNDLRFAAALLTGGALPEPATDPEAAIAEGLGASPDTAPERAARLIEEDKRGEALLRGLDLMRQGAGGNLSSLTEGLATLSALELGPLARRAALEVLLLGTPG